MTSRWVPRGALVLLGVAILLVVFFLLVLPALLGDDDSSDTSDGATFHQTLADIGLTDGVRLSDDNSTSQAFTISTPVDSTLAAAVLTLVGRTQVAESSTVFLRVLADGASVYVHELPEGDHDLDAEIDLPASATEDGAVRVQVRLTGGLDQQECNLTEDVGALVVLDGEGTGIDGSLDEPLHTVRDVAAGWDHEVTLELVVPEGSKPWFETAAQLGVALTQAGYDVSFADADGDLSDHSGSHVLVGPADALADLGWEPTDQATGSVRVGEVGDRVHLGIVEPGDVVPTLLTTSALSTADGAGNTPRSLSPERLPNGDVALESLGLDTAVQQVTSTRAWRASYSLADLPGGRVPTAVELVVQVPVTSDDARWLVQTQLNGQLVASRRLQGADGAQRVRAAIPAGVEKLHNQLVVRLTRDRDLGGCNVRQTAYDVQVLPQSGLVLGGQGAGFTQVPAAFANGFTVDLASSATEQPATTLAGLVPTLAEFTAWEQQPTFAWDAAPAARPFLHLGDPPAGVQVPIQVSDGRLTTDQMDLQAFSDGLVVQCATAGSVRGLVVTPLGEPGTLVPPYGRETARLVTDDGGGAVVTGAGRVVSEPPVRVEPTG